MKARLGATRDWATKFWLNLEAFGQRPNADFFFLVTPEWLYVWKPSKVKKGGTPTRVLDATKILGPYFQRVGTGPEGIMPLAFNMLVSLWLNDLTTPGFQGMKDVGLVLMGLLKAVAGGEVREERV
ncbi:hypothetical protein [Corallococcus sp. CA053C]|uniref:hypothetical protein n=1 Tax=Corallococcus sp. CA053C TaxID=2316732 RepID=UPI0011C3AAD6|nr:hypothetical protein [Corallococcus sp. CA053C]